MKSCFMLLFYGPKPLPVGVQLGQIWTAVIGKGGGERKTRDTLSSGNCLCW